jgi:hypothetical protein
MLLEIHWKDAKFIEIFFVVREIYYIHTITTYW